MSRLPNAWKTSFRFRARVIGFSFVTTSIDRSTSENVSERGATGVPSNYLFSFSAENSVFSFPVCQLPVGVELNAVGSC